MIPQVSQSQWERIMKTVNAAYAEARSAIGDESDEFLRGYVRAYEDSNLITRFVGSLGLSLAQKHIRYSVAEQTLTERELRAMDDDTLSNVAVESLGFFASSRRCDRRRKAVELVYERAVA